MEEGGEVGQRGSNRSLDIEHRKEKQKKRKTVSKTIVEITLTL